jgi:hypothetical protein
MRKITTINLFYLLKLFESFSIKTQPGPSNFAVNKPPILGFA